MSEIITCGCGRGPLAKEVAFTGYIVKCYKCGAQTFPPSCSREAAIKKWNVKHKHLLSEQLRGKHHPLGHLGGVGEE